MVNPLAGKRIMRRYQRNNCSKTELCVTWYLQNKTEIRAIYLYSTYFCLVQEGPCDSYVLHQSDEMLT